MPLTTEVLQKIPAWPGPGHRPETGPMQFGDDWPGVFIRGDAATMSYAPAVARAIEELEKNKEFWIATGVLKGLFALLMSCEAK